MFLGRVEKRDDPEKMGRIRARVFGMHTEDIPADKLPWLLPAYPITSSQKGGIGDSGVPEIGSTVVVQFVCGNIMQGIYTGTVPGSGDLPNSDSYLENTGHRKITTPSGHSVEITDKLVKIVADDRSTTIEISDGAINIKAPSGTVTVDAKEILLQDSTNSGDLLINSQKFLQYFLSHTHPSGTGPTGPVIPANAGLKLNSDWHTETVKAKV